MMCLACRHFVHEGVAPRNLPGVPDILVHREDTLEKLPGVSGSPVQHKVTPENQSSPPSTQSHQAVAPEEHPGKSGSFPQVTEQLAARKSCHMTVTASSNT